jgi:5-methyltetrahydrofolate--homocysteine methyltransferase
MEKISEKIQSGKILLSDGSWDTLFRMKGILPHECSEQWNLKYPEEVYDIARSYIDAGANIIQTNSFGGNRFRLKKYGLESKVQEINEAAARLSRQAAGSKRNVLGCIGPICKPGSEDRISEEQKLDAFKEQILALESGGADTILLESLPDIEEIDMALRAVSKNTRCEIMFLTTFIKTSNGEYKNPAGLNPQTLMPLLIDNGVNILGVSCGGGFEETVNVIKELRKINKEFPLLVQANAGMPELKNGQAIFPVSPEKIGTYVPRFLEVGANIIGGCLGTTPDHIRTIGIAIRALIN